MAELRVVVRRLNDSDDDDTSITGSGQLYDRRFIIVGEPLSRVFAEGEPSSAWLVEISFSTAEGPDKLEVIPVASWVRGGFRDGQAPLERLELPPGRRRLAIGHVPSAYVGLTLAKESQVPQSLLLPPPVGEGFPCKWVNFPFCSP